MANQTPSRTNGVSHHSVTHPFIQVSQLRRLRECEQVAAVCYRLHRGRIQFLLVQTRGSGRWIFPKGGVEPGLTHAQAAALEAFEEAGVHGRMEEKPFAQYVRRQHRTKKNQTETVNAHLCRVLWLDSPEESGRNPTWFSASSAKRCLQENRSSKFGAELARVLHLAETRVQRLAANTAARSDGLQHVTFEAAKQVRGLRRWGVASFSRRTAQEGVNGEASALEFAIHSQLSKVLQFVPRDEFRRTPALLVGSQENAIGDPVAQPGEGIVCRPPRPSAQVKSLPRRKQRETKKTRRLNVSS